MNALVDHLKLFIGDKSITVKDAKMLGQLSNLDHYDRKELRNRLLNDSMLIEEKDEAIHWLKECFKVIDQNAFRIHKVYFSPGTEISEALIDVLKKANVTADICVFSITDAALAKEILNCYKRGVKVRIITDDQKIFDRGSEIQWMKGKGIDIKIDHSQYHMHNKFGVIDERIVFTGSFNWTYTASKHNQENLLVTTNHAIVEQFSGEFDRLWKEMYEL